VAPLLGLNGRRYTDPEFARLERTRVLLPSWQLAGHVSDLPAAGTALRFDFAGRSAVVLRGRDGKLRAFLNVCRHRGSRLVDGDARTGLAFCVAGRLRCPYHAWEYDDQGALAHVPDDGQYEGLERAQLALQQVGCETWGGFVFVAFEPPAQPVARMLEPVQAELGAYRGDALRRLGEPTLERVGADWKLMCEQRLDQHHLAVARPALKPAIGQGLGLDVIGNDIVRTTAAIAAAEGTSWSVRAYAKWLPESAALPAACRRTWSRYFIWPNLTLDVFPDLVVATSFLPAGPGEALARTLAYGVPDASREWRLARYLNQRVRRHAAAEDRRMLERVQQGMATGDYLAGPVADAEAGLRWYIERMRRAAPATVVKSGMPARARTRSA
jgi:carnitine monooxygenase subunit